MTTKSERIVSLVLQSASVSALVWGFAVGCNDQEPEALPSSGSTGGTGEAGGTGAAGGSGGRAGSGGVTISGCDTAPCEGFTSSGIGYSPCCLSQTACGVSVGARCVERGAFTPLEGGSGGFDLGDEEVIVLDPTCASLSSIMGMMVEMPGCCDATGICGISTENVEKTLGFPLPTACVTRNDSGIGQFLASALPEDVSCNYPGGDDAGAPD